MRQAVAIGVFACMVIAQLAVPAWMIAGPERVLQHGVAYKLRTRPVDPEDLFRGRYVALNYEQNFAPRNPTEHYNFGDSVLARIETGADGFAHIAAISRTKPKSGDYFRAQVTTDNADEGKVYLTFPFVRFYMDEFKAPKAEEAYRQHSHKGSNDAFVTIRVWNGDAAIEDVYVGGVPIAQYVEQEIAAGAQPSQSP